MEAEGAEQEGGCVKNETESEQKRKKEMEEMDGGGLVGAD